MATLFFAAGALLIAAVAGRWASSVLHRRTLAGSEPPRLAQMEKVAEALTKGVILLTAVLGIVAARDGGVGRLVANGGVDIRIALVCTVLSVLFAFAGWVVIGAAPDRGVTGLWFAMTVASVALIAASAFGVFKAGQVADGKLERPSLSVEQGEEGLKFVASIDLLKADAFMRTTVYGYPADGRPRELLFNSTSGPDAKGKASLTGVVRSVLEPYEVVEVRAFRGSIDPGCERPIEPGTEATETGPAACASIWIEPKAGR